MQVADSPLNTPSVESLRRDALVIGVVSLSHSVSHFLQLALPPLFPLLLCAYPIFETVFTMYRRRVLRGVATAEPDGIHLHTLIHRRLIRLNVGPEIGERRRINRNSMTSPYLWLLCLLSIIPSVLWWNSTRMLSIFLLLFIFLYVFLYWRIVRFRTPRWLGPRRDPRAAPRAFRQPHEHDS